MKGSLRFVLLVLIVLIASAGASPLLAGPETAQAARPIPSPEDHLGHRIGADRKLVRWDAAVEYLRMVAEASARVDLQVIGPTTHGRPFVVVEIASEETLAGRETYRALQKRLYFQDHRPGEDPDAVHTLEQRQEIFERGKAVVLITCTIHSTEVGAAQMSLELVHHLATDDGPRTRKILDNVIFLLVPSLNPDGQAMVVDWYDAYLGTEQEAGPMPWLYHPYVGHDNNRDMYMYTQVESQWIGKVLYEDWFPSIWLDEHQMGSLGPRIFVMPATDPINLNVHPLIYRLNGVYGQAQAAALEAAGKIGIIYDYTYTNFWQGAMAWTGWWHNQVGLLTEVASARIATPLEQRSVRLGESAPREEIDFQQARRLMYERPGEPLPPPRDVQPRTTYPRPWLGGRWTLRDIVDYELIATLGLLETAAETRSQLLRHLYEVNRSTIAQFLKGQKPGEARELGAGDGGGGYGDLPAAFETERPESGRLMPGFSGSPDTPYAVVIPAEQHDPAAPAKMLRVLDRAGVVVERARSTFRAGHDEFPAGTYVIRLAQVFGRYAKDLLEPQSYPEVRRAPSLPPDPPYDVTAWSLGMLMGVETRFVDEPFEASLEIVDPPPLPEGGISGKGSTYLVSASLNDGFTLANRLLSEKADVRRAMEAFDLAPDRGFAPGSWVIQGADRSRLDAMARELGVPVQAVQQAPPVAMTSVVRPRIGVYQPWGSNMDEGWTRWVLEQFGFDYTTLHPQDLRAAGARDASRFEIPEELRAAWPPHVAAKAPATVSARPLAERFDVILLTHQSPDEIVQGDRFPVIPPVYRGGIGAEGLAALREFTAAGGTLVALGDATGFLLRHWPIPVRNVVGGLEPRNFLIPGSILHLECDPDHPLAWGMPERSFGYFVRNPVFAIDEGFRDLRVTVPVRYPNADIRVSGWIRGEQFVTGRAAAVQVELDAGGRLVLLGLRPQHRAQTHATFKLLFNALMTTPHQPTGRRDETADQLRGR